LKAPFENKPAAQETMAEVFWYSDQCNFQQVHRMSFETIVPDDSGAEANISLPTWRLEKIFPSGASLAQVHLSAAGNGIAALDNVSLRSTANPISNGDSQAKSNPKRGKSLWVIHSQVYDLRNGP
jgi:hypothetical protein